MKENIRRDASRSRRKECILGSQWVHPESPAGAISETPAARKSEALASAKSRKCLPGRPAGAKTEPGSPAERNSERTSSPTS